MPKTSFDIKIDAKDKPITLYCVISPDNPKQQGKNFLEFVRLVNEQPMGDIAKVILIDGSYLQRHYDFRYSDANNQKFLFEWREANKQFIRQLQVPYEVISWAQLVNGGRYQAIYEKIKKSFDEGTDEKFRAIVMSIARQFTYKGSTKQTTPYLLEECAGTLLLEGYLTYPGKLNAAIQYVIKQYQVGPKFISYTLGNFVEQPKEQRSTDDASASTSMSSAPPAPASTKLPFFNQKETFPNAMSFSDSNHVWAIKCDIEFMDESKDEAIKTLLASIEAAKKDYEGKREKLSHPVVLEYKQRFTHYMLSYQIIMKNSRVLINTNPFSLLMHAVELKSGILNEGQPTQLELKHDAATPQSGTST